MALVALIYFIEWLVPGIVVAVVVAAAARRGDDKSAYLRANG